MVINDWISVSPDNGCGEKTVTITLTKNETGSSRIYQIPVYFDDGLIKYITVKQPACGATLSVAPVLLEYPASGGTKWVNVYCSHEWSLASKPDWLSADVMSGTSGTTFVNLTAERNGGDEGLTGTIIFRSVLNGSVKEASVSVSQKYYYLEVTPTVLEYEYDSTDMQTITVSSGGEWTAVDYPDWLTLSQIKGGEGTATITVKVTVNDYEERTGTIRFLSGGLERTVSVRQKEEPVPVPLCDDALCWGTYNKSGIGLYIKIRINNTDYYPQTDKEKWSLCDYTGGNLISLNGAFDTGSTINDYYRRILFSDRFNTSSVTDMSSMFNGNKGITRLDLSNFNTSNVTNMSYMFEACGGLKNLDLSSFNTSNVTGMVDMFGNCKNLETVSLSSFDTSKVTSMEGMFLGCEKLTSLDLSNFNTGNVTRMDSMFYACRNLETVNLSSFNTSKVTAMFDMFMTCRKLTSLDLSSFNTSNVTNMLNMFSWCTALTSLDLSGFNTSNVTSMGSMFSNSTALETLDLSNFNTSKVTNMSYMFNNCTSLTTVKVINCNSATQQKILTQLQTDLSSYTWTLSNGIITRS